MMWHRSISVMKQTTLFSAALLFMAPQLLAGEHVRAGNRSTTSAAPVSAPVARTVPPVAVVVVPVTISVAMTKPAQAESERVYVDLRSPDGQRRTFAVEGGPSVIQTQPVLVLRPGQSMTIRLALK